MKRLHPGTLATTLVAVLYLGSLFFIRPSVAPGPPGSSTSYGPSGLHAFYTLVSHPPGAGATRIVTEPETGLDTVVPTLLICQPQVDLSKATAQAWLDLARSGQQLVVATNQTDALVAALGARMMPVGAAGSHPVSGVIRMGAQRDRAPHAIAANDPLAVQWSGRGSQIVWQGAHPRVETRGWLYLAHRPPVLVAVSFHYGHGRITILSLPQLLYNGDIGAAQNLDVVLALLAPHQQAIGFVETVHGDQVVPGALATLGPGVEAAVWMLGLALLLWIWSQARRFGRPILVIPPLEPASLAYAEALGERARTRADRVALWTSYAAFVTRQTGRDGNRPAAFRPPPPSPAATRRESISTLEAWRQHLAAVESRERRGNR